MKSATIFVLAGSEPGGAWVSIPSLPSVQLWLELELNFQSTVFWRRQVPLVAILAPA